MKISVVTLTCDRLPILQKCLHSVWATWSGRNELELIVVDNASEDGTAEWVRDQTEAYAKLVRMDQNYKVWSRNAGFDAATGDVILQLDDDAWIGAKNWDVYLLDQLAMDEEVIAVGQQAWFRAHPFNAGPGGRDASAGQYCDLITGFCWMMRNEGYRYDDFFKFRTFDDETDIQFQMKADGWRLKCCHPVALHVSQRGDVDWDERGQCLQYISDKWEDAAGMGWEEP